MLIADDVLEPALLELTTITGLAQHRCEFLVRLPSNLPLGVCDPFEQREPLLRNRCVSLDSIAQLL
jgi:hypothetical protein